jgi:phosphoribosylamine-glycine ligase
VLNVVGRGPDLAAARRRAADGVAELSWPGMHHRTDIGMMAS